MNFQIDSIWPLRIDLNRIECREILREKELLCYSDVVSVLRAQGPPNDEKKSILGSLQKLFSISDDRNRLELRRAANNEQLATISEAISGFDGFSEWSALGSLQFPPTQRPRPRTIYNDKVCQTVKVNLEQEKSLPSPIMSNDLELSKSIEETITSKRLTRIDQSKLISNASTNTDAIKSVPKCSPPKESSNSLDYNLHLLSEIATGESNQSINALDSSDSDIKPDIFSIHNQIEDIELPVTMHNVHMTSQSQNIPNNNMVIPINTNSLNINAIQSTSSMIKNVSSLPNDPNIFNISNSNSVPVIGNSNINQSLGQRIVIPLNTLSSQNVSNFVSNQNKHLVSNILPQKQIQTNAFYTIPNNAIRSPPTNPLGYSWSAQPPQTQQVIIQNAPTHHGFSGVQTNISHQTLDNLAPFSYVLQRRVAKIDQHQNNKQTLVVKDLGSQPSMDSERNKRFMVVKGGNTLGPSSKKPKMSNPSNRQPGRPPLMPAPGSVYKPYLANDLSSINRTPGNLSSPIMDSTSVTDTNSLKISSISSGPRILPVSSPQIMSNPYFNSTRGNGVQRITSSGSGSGSVIQLGSGTSLRAMESASVPGGKLNTLKPKDRVNIPSLLSIGHQENEVQ